MANEIQHRHTAASDNLYAVIQNAVGQYWNTADGTFEALGATWGAYDITLNRSANGYQHAGTFPADVPPGYYYVVIFKRIGGSVAVTDPMVARITMPRWNEETFVLGNTQPGADQFLQSDLL